MASHLSNDLNTLSQDIALDRQKLTHMESGILLRELPSLNRMILEYNIQIGNYQQQIAFLPKRNPCSRLFQKVCGELQQLSSQVDGLRNKVLFSFTNGPATRSMRGKFEIAEEAAKMMDEEFMMNPGLIPRSSCDTMRIFGAVTEIEIGAADSFCRKLLKEVDGIADLAEHYAES